MPDTRNKVDLLEVGAAPAGQRRFAHGAATP
jgi:hypothetical protein